MSETLYGAAEREAASGYVPMPEKKTDNSEISLEDAAESIEEEQPQIIERGYFDDDGNPAPDNETVTLERAARDYAELLEADAKNDEEAELAELARETDELRAKALAENPKLADEYGIEPLETEQPEAKTEPAISPEVQQRLDEAEQTKQAYSQSTDAAFELAQATLVTQFPEFGGLDEQGRAAAAEAMAQRDPERFERLTKLIEHSQQIEMHRDFAKAQEQEQKALQFQSYAKAEDAKVDEYLAKEPPEQRAKLRAELFDMAKSYGLEQAQFMSLFQTEPIMRNSAFQKMMLDAAKYQLISKAPKAVAAKPVPRVQRPGSGRDSASESSETLQMLEANLTRTGSVKDAEKLLFAKLKAAG